MMAGRRGGGCGGAARVRVLIWLGLLAAGIAGAAVARPPSVPPADAPERAAPGPLPVGVRTLAFDAAPARRLSVVLFYPAAAPGRATVHRHGTGGAVAGIPSVVAFEALASAEAAPAGGAPLPLVVLSHGFNRWATAMSGIAENLASRGYVVASIDHGDDWTDDAPRRTAAFATAFVRRSLDQRAAIAWLRRLAASGDPVGRRIDPGNVSIIGYSMGGFGALASGGAGYDPAGPLMARVPAGAMAAVSEGAAAVPGLRALVLIAPWGGAAETRGFTPAALASIRTPSLWIMGDHDDVAGADGIRWLYDHATASDRRLLVLADARHNLGGNPPPASAPDTARLRDALDEPVWRKDMADAIVQRQIAAFLDVTAKGDAAAAMWLDAAADGTLKGFQNRWQLGVTMTRAQAR